jgi:hypothetical protein
VVTFNSTQRHKNTKFTKEAKRKGKQFSVLRVFPRSRLLFIILQIVPLAILPILFFCCLLNLAGKNKDKKDREAAGYAG